MSNFFTLPVNVIIYLIVVVFLSCVSFWVFKRIPKIDWWEYYKDFSSSIKPPSCLNCVCSDEKLQHFHFNRVVSVFINYFFILLFCIFWLLILIAKIGKEIDISGIDYVIIGNNDILINSYTIEQIYINVLSVSPSYLPILLIVSLFFASPLFNYFISCFTSKNISINPNLINWNNLLKTTFNLNTKNDFLTCFMKVVTFFIVYSIIIFLFGLDNRIFFFGLNSDTIPIVLTSSTILFQRMIVIEELIDICGCKN